MVQFQIGLRAQPSQSKFSPRFSGLSSAAAYIYSANVSRCLSSAPSLNSPASVLVIAIPQIYRRDWANRDRCQARGLQYREYLQ